MAMETVSEAIDRLTKVGYTDRYRAKGHGLKSASYGTIFPPNAFRVDEVVRFEGASDPADECAVFALAVTADGTKGTYTVAFGPMMDALDSEIVRFLEPR